MGQHGQAAAPLDLCVARVHLVQSGRLGCSRLVFFSRLIDGHGRHLARRDLPDQDKGQEEEAAGRGAEEVEFVHRRRVGEIGFLESLDRLVDYALLEEVELAGLGIRFLLHRGEEGGVQFGMLLLDVPGDLPIVHLGLTTIDEECPNRPRDQDKDDPANRVVGQDGPACGKPYSQTSDRRHQSPQDGHHAPLTPKVLPPDNGFQIRS